MYLLNDFSYDLCIYLFPHAAHEIEAVIKCSPTWASKTQYITKLLDSNTGGCGGAP